MTDVDELSDLVGRDVTDLGGLTDELGQLTKNHRHPFDVVVTPTNHPFVVEERFDGVDEEWIGLLGTVTVVELDDLVE